MNWYIILKSLHMFGLIVGFGGVVFTAVISAKSLKSVQLFKLMPSITKVFSNVIWIGFLLLFVTGFLLEERVEGMKNVFWLLQLKKAAVFIIAFHGIYVSLYLAKKMKQLADLDNPFEALGFKKFKILGMVSASISLTLWSLATILGIWISAV